MTEKKRVVTDDMRESWRLGCEQSGMTKEASAEWALKIERQFLARNPPERRYDHDASVVYVDPKGARHTALVTAWWGQGADHPAGRSEPSCNVAYVNGDHDSVDKPIASASSVVHKSLQSAHGNYWCWPDEA